MGAGGWGVLCCGYHTHSHFPKNVWGGQGWITKWCVGYQCANMASCWGELGEENLKALIYGPR